MSKLAVVLFNLGGPDNQAAVRPFLYNLFNDPAIIDLPFPFRSLLAFVISTARKREACANYLKMGGGSPILSETRDQAVALEKALSSDSVETKCFPAMRYWHPFIEEVVAGVERFNPDNTVLLPLYPQFSTATTGSSLKGWIQANGGDAIRICCYPQDEGLCRAHADLIVQAWKKGGCPEPVRILFSAHGLPEQTVKNGDPYQFQVERTVDKIIGLLGNRGWEHEICYQSKVGPLKWISPSTEDAVRRASVDKRAMIVCPVAFVSEHIETLVELDQEYAEIAAAKNVIYLRSMTPRTHPAFIEGLANMVRTALDRPEEICARKCPEHWSKCPR